MGKIIMLHKKSKHHSKLFIISGLLYGVFAGSKLFANELVGFDLLLVIIYLFVAIYLLIYGLKLIRIPRIEVDEKSIWSKGDIFSKPNSFEWDSIRDMSFGSYEIEFEFNDTRKQKLRINTSIPEISITVKEAITEIAIEKTIKVNPG